jgi:hypothetical protein
LTVQLLVERGMLVGDRTLSSREKFEKDTMKTDKESCSGNPGFSRYVKVKVKYFCRLQIKTLV